jgi:hypothetical protein
LINTLVALGVGYVVGAKTGGKDLDQLGRSLKALCETDEFSDVVSAGRAQVASTLRELAAIVDGGRLQPVTNGDLVTRVRHLVGHD